MTIKGLTQEEQQRLNGYIRRKDVLEYILIQSIHVEPATQEQVQQFLIAAPPEIFVLLDGFMPLPSPAVVHNESLHENRIVQSFVSMVTARR